MRGIRRFPRAATYVTLALLAGVATLSLSQCTQVGDSLTGTQIGRLSHKKQSCKKECERDHKLLKKQESALHKANKKACDKDSSCEDAEKARHEAAKEALEDQLKVCRASCHRQGTVFSD